MDAFCAIDAVPNNVNTLSTLYLFALMSFQLHCSRLFCCLGRLTNKWPLPPSSRTSHRGYSYFTGKKGEPKPFLNTEAHKVKVDETYSLNPAEVKQGRYGIPLGLGLFCFIMYFGFVREYGENDKAIMEFLNKDISDKVPPPRMKRIKQQIEEGEQMSDRVPEHVSEQVPNGKL